MSGFSRSLLDCSDWDTNEFWLEARASDVNRRFGGNAATINVNTRNEDGRTPLLGAAAFGTAETIDALVAAGADIHARNDKGGAPLHFAAANGTAATTNALVAAGADIDA